MFTAFCACDCSDPRHHYCTAWLPIAYYLLFRTSVGGQWTHAAVKNKLFSFILLVTVSSCRGIVGGTDASQLIVCLFAAVTATGSSANSMRGAFTEGNVWRVWFVLEVLFTFFWTLVYGNVCVRVICFLFSPDNGNFVSPVAAVERNLHLIWCHQFW